MYTGNERKYIEPNYQPENSQPNQPFSYDNKPILQKKAQPKVQLQEQEVKEEPRPMCWYVLSWVVFISAMVLYVGVWAIDYFANSFLQNSYFYFNAFAVSSYLDGGVYSDSTKINTATLTDPTPTAMSILYTWLLWKFPLIVFTYNLIQKQQKKILKFGTLIALVVILLAADITLTIYALSIYSDYLFYAGYVLLTLIIAIINNSGLDRTKQAVKNTLAPLLMIGGLYACYSLLLPTLYNVEYNGIGASYTPFLIIYLYPFFDLAFYAILLLLGTTVEDEVKNFHGMIHFLLLGYGVGMILLTGYTEVQFYYLLGYFIFRNIFVNHVMRKWDRVVCNPPALPGWAVLYYISYLLNFLPVIGVGKLVVSRGYHSQMFSRANTYLYGTPNPLYPSTTFASSSINFSFVGNIFWLAALIIWVGTTFTQKYQRRKPSLYDFFYYLIGIQWFYIGITCALQIPVLMTSAHL